MKKVLIETYWNVNSNDDSVSNDEQIRLNRNILECKLH